ncbi:alpha/beta fold hydrolase [Maribacter sp. 2308TA10-17]|uniref:alpha/beta fold hydrolase n=1 Tax=Maribacter sp. 2308TA10-17 TaxID=3386276 RepID=UPI0039BD67C1
MKALKSILIISFFLSVFGLNAQTPFEVTVKGEGQPVLLFPGFTCTGEVWEDTVTELSKNYECHIFTFAGFGGVTPIEKPWLPKIKEGIVKYVQEKKLENTIIIGHSLGGALGLWLATAENHPYSKLIIVDSLPSTGALMMPNFKSENMVYDNPWNKQMLEMDAEAFEKMASQMASGMTLNTEKHQQLKDWIIQSDRETYVYGYTDLLKLDLREDIAQITIPVTILGATHPYGLETAKKTYEEQYKSLEKYKIEFAEGSAHFIMYDQPEWFLDQITRELE